jgi:hypothetical protein
VEILKLATRKSLPMQRSPRKRRQTSRQAPARRTGNRPVAEINRRFSKYATRLVSAQPCTAVSIEETKAEFTRVLIDSALASAGDMPFAH